MESLQEMITSLILANDLRRLKALQQDQKLPRSGVIRENGRYRCWAIQDLAILFDRVEIYRRLLLIGKRIPIDKRKLPTHEDWLKQLIASEQTQLLSWLFEQSDRLLEVLQLDAAWAQDLPEEL